MKSPGCERWCRWYRRWERRLRWVVIIAMIVAGVAWIVYTPYRDDAVWRAIPAETLYFSRHLRAADRLDAYVRNPVTMTLFRSVGFDPVQTRLAFDDPPTRQWIERLFGRDLVLAYVPDLGGPGGEPAWVFASWTGSRAQRLRWTMSLTGLPGVRSIRLPGHPTFYRLDPAPVADGLHVSLALTDGLLLGCVSADPVGVRFLTATRDRQAGYPALGSTAWLPTARRLTGDEAPDWGAYALREMIGTDDVPTSLLPVLRQLEPDYAAGDLVGTFHITAAARADAPPPLDGLAAILGDAPVFWSLVSPALLTSLTRQPDTPRWAVTLAQALRRPPAGDAAGDAADDAADGAADGAPDGGPGDDGVPYPFFCALLDERFAGSISGGTSTLASLRIRGLTIPAVVAGFYVGDERQADSVLMSLLDTLNREYRMGLIPRRAPGEMVTVIENTRAETSFYDRLLLQEQVGVVYHDGWLLAAGQSSVLERLIDDAAGPARPPAAWRWMPPSGTDASILFTWADLDAFGVLANDALGMVTLMLLLRDSAATLETRRRLAEVHAWIEGMRALRQGTIWLDSRDTRFHVRFELGTAEDDRRR